MSKKARWTGLILIVPLFFLWGFALGMLDVLNKHFQTVLGLTKLQSTGLQVATFGAYVVFPPLIGGPFIRRWGYKHGVVLGLGLFVVGALMFWPSAKFLKFGGFVGATFVMACGLSELEVVANTYMAILGSPEHASRRVTIAQAFNGIGFILGPLIASHAFFSGDNSTNLTSVQYVYLGIAVAATFLATGFVFAKLPEVSDDLMLEQAVSTGDAEIAARPLHKQWHTLFGWVAQFVYCATQVTFATFFLNYVTEVDTSISDAFASNLLSVGLSAFTVGRFISAGLMCFFKPRHILVVWAFMAALLTGLTIGLRGPGAVVALIFVMGFESSMYPTIFSLSIHNLGANTKKGGTFMVMAVGGGAVFPPIQGAIADAIGTPKSQCIPTIGFCIVLIYALFLAEPFGKKNKDTDLEKTVQKNDEIEEARHEDSML
jgi:FHS family L-fucose permease-like MFS transporter